MIYTVTLNPALDRELVVPEIRFDEVLRASGWQIDFGGKGFNVSRLLANFGQTSTAMGFLGGDTGITMEKGIRALGIRADFVTVTGETRTNVSIRSYADSRYIKVNEPGPTITNADVTRLVDRIDEVAQPGDWWVLAGNLPPGCPARIYADIITIVQGRGGKAVLDTSGEALRLGCAAEPYLCKPNIIEAQGLMSDDTLPPLDLAAAVRGLGPQHIILSVGADGAAYSGPADTFTARPPQIDEKNPIGAGDSMVGGLVFALQQGLDMREAVRWGIACGAATASREGTSIATKQAAEDLRARVSIM